MTELLPCPFCGEKAVYEPDYSSSNDNIKLVAVGCEGDDCNNYQCARTKEKAIERWNRRAPIPDAKLSEETYKVHPRDADRTYELAKEIECCRHALCPMSRDALDKALAALPPATTQDQEQRHG
jgi:Lar family restriction alleviation protein